MPRVTGVDYRSFSDVEHQLAQEDLAARQLAQQAGAQQANIRLRQQQMQQQAEIESARMAQSQQQFEAGFALDERRAGLSEIQEARRQFEAVTAQEMAREREARMAQQYERTFQANQLERARAQGLWWNPATGAFESASGPNAPEHIQQLAREGVEQRRQEREFAERGMALRESAEARRGMAQIGETFGGAQLQLPFGMGGVTLPGGEPTPQQRAAEVTDYYEALRAQGVPQEVAEREAFGFVRKPMPTVGPAEIRKKQAEISAAIGKLDSLTTKAAAEAKERGARAPGEGAPDTYQERIAIQKDILKTLRAELAEMKGEEVEQPAPLGRAGRPGFGGAIPTTEAEADAEAQALGISRPSVTGATPPDTPDKMTYEWWYEQTLPHDLAGKYAETGAIPALRNMWLKIKDGKIAAAGSDYDSLPAELKRTVAAELDRLNLLPKVPK